MDKKYKRLKYACYSSGFSMSVVSCLSPLLFTTMREMYSVSYSLMGLLVLINFVTQLCVDLLFSFYSHKFNVRRCVKMMPVISLAGLLIYASSPWIFKGYEYAGLCIGTIVFSAAAGLSEVLTSPVLATIPFDNPDREMSKLHSMFAWGVVGVVIFSSLFLWLFGRENWNYLTFLLCTVPLVSAILFSKSDIPDMNTDEKVSGGKGIFKNKKLWLFVLIIFFGGSSECTMSQWSSVYLEKALAIPKVWGDVFGTALFSAFLGLGRTLYANKGKSIEKVLYISSIGATLCYLICAISPSPFLGLIACVMTGLCTAMLWPGSLIAVTDAITDASVLVFALMASGGDLGASVGPQLVGMVTDGIMNAPFARELCEFFALSAEQLAMRTGILVGMIFPLLSIGLFRKILKDKNKKTV